MRSFRDFLQILAIGAAFRIISGRIKALSSASSPLWRKVQCVLEGLTMCFRTSTVREYTKQCAGKSQLSRNA